MIRIHQVKGASWHNADTQPVYDHAAQRIESRYLNAQSEGPARGCGSLLHREVDRAFRMQTDMVEGGRAFKSDAVTLGERVPGGDDVNRPEYAASSILLAGENFGCGSSREHAVWVLQQNGFRAVIAPSFGDRSG